MRKRLSYPLPHRASYHTRCTAPVTDPITGRVLHPARRLFASRPYTQLDVLRSLQAGGWFNFATTDFADRETAAYARSAQDFFETLRQEGA